MIQADTYYLKHVDLTKTLQEINCIFAKPKSICLSKNNEWAICIVGSMCKPSILIIFTLYYLLVSLNVYQLTNKPRPDFRGRHGSGGAQVLADSVNF